MDINAVDIVVLIILLISGSMGYIVVSESRRISWQRRIMFMGRKGEMFLNVLIVVTLPLFIGSAIYLGLTAWILCAIGVPLNFLLNRFLSPFVLKLLILPMYVIFSLFYREQE